MSAFCCHICFSFRRILYHTDSPRAIPPPQIGNWQHWDWQHSPTVGRAHTLARPSGCLRQCSLRGFASSVHVLGEPPTSPDESHDITSRAAVSMNGVKSCRPSRPPNSFRRLIDGYSTTLTPPTGPDPRMPRCGVLCGMPTAPSATCHCTGRPAQARRSRWRLSPYRTACR